VVEKKIMIPYMDDFLLCFTGLNRDVQLTHYNKTQS
jgi:hypothetical protein